MTARTLNERARFWTYLVHFSGLGFHFMVFGFLSRTILNMVRKPDRPYISPFPSFSLSLSLSLSLARSVPGFHPATFIYRKPDPLRSSSSHFWPRWCTSTANISPRFPLRRIRIRHIPTGNLPRPLFIITHEHLKRTLRHGVEIFRVCEVET